MTPVDGVLVAVIAAAVTSVIVDLVRARRLSMALDRGAHAVVDPESGLAWPGAMSVELPVAAQIAAGTGHDLGVVVIRVDAETAVLSLTALRDALRRHEPGWRLEVDEACVVLYADHPHEAVRAAARLVDRIQTAGGSVRDIGLSLASLDTPAAAPLYGAAATRRVPPRRLAEVAALVTGAPSPSSGATQT